MYEIGQKVLYGVNGACVISAITTKDISGTTIEYYELQPIFSNVSKLFVPTGSESLLKKMRPIIGKPLAETVLSNMSAPQLWNNNKNERMEAFREIIARGEIAELVSLIRTIKAHEAEQAKKGRRLHMADERILKETERMVYDELALALDVERASVADMIIN